MTQENLNPDDIGPSDDLMSSMDTEDLIEDDIKKAFSERVNKDNSVKTAQELGKNYPYTPSQNIPEELFPSFVDDEQFIRTSATLLYITIDKKASRYIKTWCQANDFNQVWSIPKISQMRSRLQYKNVFEPLLYSIKMVHKFNKDNNFVLIQFMPTPIEARIQGAKKIGFFESIEYKAAVKEIPPRTMDILNSNKTYMEDVKNMSIFKELKEQIDKVRFVPQDIRAKWAADLETRILASKGVV